MHADHTNHSHSQHVEIALDLCIRAAATTSDMRFIRNTARRYINDPDIAEHLVKTAIAASNMAVASVQSAILDPEGTEDFELDAPRLAIEAYLAGHDPSGGADKITTTSPILALNWPTSMQYSCFRGLASLAEPVDGVPPKTSRATFDFVKRIARSEAEEAVFWAIATERLDDSLVTQAVPKLEALCTEANPKQAEGLMRQCGLHDAICKRTAALVAHRKLAQKWLNPELLFTNLLLSDDQRLALVKFITGIVEARLGCRPIALLCYGACGFGIRPKHMLRLLNAVDFGMQRIKVTDERFKLPKRPGLLSRVFGGRKSQPSLDAFDALAESSGLQGLYLRPFVVDGVPEEAPIGDNMLTETDLIHTLSKSTMLTALAGPGEEIERAAIPRFDLGIDAWQDLIAMRMVTSNFVLLRYHSTPGVRWEMKTVLRLIHPSLIIVLFSSVSGPDQTSAKENWLDFHSQFAHMIPSELPADLLSDCFLTFDRDWAPHLHPFKTAKQCRESLLDIISRYEDTDEMYMNLAADTKCQTELWNLFPAWYGHIS